MTNANEIVGLILPNAVTPIAIVLGIVGYIGVRALATEYDWKHLQPAAVLIAFGGIASLLVFLVSLNWQATISYFLWLIATPAIVAILTAVGGPRLSALSRWLGDSPSALWRRLGGE